MKISVLAAIALAAIVAVPGASYAASKHKSSDGLANPATCTGGGCTAQNPDRVTQPCNGSNCYKRSRKHKPAAASSSK
jgi:hypothetical protein